MYLCITFIYFPPFSFMIAVLIRSLVCVEFPLSHHSATFSPSHLQQATTATISLYPPFDQ